MHHQPVHLVPSPRRQTTTILVAGLFCLFGLESPLAADTVDADEWLAVKTQSFTLLTNAEPLRGAEIAVNLEIFRATFERLAPGLELRSVVPTTFFAFRDRYSYAPYKSVPDSRHGSILGQFLIHPDRNFLTLDASAKLGLDSDFAVIYHEFVHYLVAHNFAEVPRWFHEGLAEYYSTFAIEDEAIYVGRPVSRHQRWLRYDNADRETSLLTHDFSLRAVLTGESGHHGSRAGGFYAMSWALVHYLLSGGPERLDQLADFLVRLRDDEEPDDAFERAFDLRIESLEETLRDYASRDPRVVRSSTRADDSFPVARLEIGDLGPISPPSARRVPSADVLFHLGNLALRLGRTDAGDHFRAALELDVGHADALAGLALMHDYESRLSEAEVIYADALAKRPKDPLTYLRYGRHLLARILPSAAGELVSASKLVVAGELALGSEVARGEEVETAEELAADARGAFARAIELDGEFAQARVLYGYGHLFGEVDPEPGIRAVEKARAWLPDRDDLTSILLLLHLKDRNFERARYLLRTVLAEHASAERLLWAEEEVARAELLHAGTEALADRRIEEALNLFDEAIAVTSDQGLRDHMSERLRRLQERL